MVDPQHYHEQLLKEYSRTNSPTQRRTLLEDNYQVQLGMLAATEDRLAYHLDNFNNHAHLLVSLLLAPRDKPMGVLDLLKLDQLDCLEICAEYINSESEGERLCRGDFGRACSILSEMVKRIRSVSEQTQMKSCLFLLAAVGVLLITQLDPSRTPKREHLPIEFVDWCNNLTPPILTATLAPEVNIANAVVHLEKELSVLHDANQP